MEKFDKIILYNIAKYLIDIEINNYVLSSINHLILVYKILVENNKYIKKLSRVFYGIQNESIEKLNKINVSKNEIKFMNRHQISIKGYNFFTFTICKSLNNANIFNDFILNCSDDKIERIDISVGGMVIDKVYQETFSTLRQIYKMKSNIIPINLLQYRIPYLLYHNIQLNIFMKEIFNGDLILSYNECFDTYNKDVFDHQGLDFPFFQIQYMGKINIKSHSTIRLSLNNIIHYIIIQYDTLWSDKTNVKAKVKKYIKLKLDNYELILYRKCIIDNNHVYELSNGINFSKVNNSLLNTIDFVYDLTEINYIRICAISSNIFRYDKYLGGLLYSS